MNVKDFVYLDVERIRSLLAHASGGLPTERSRQQQHQAGGAAAAKAGLPWLIQGSGIADYRFVRTDQETLSLHDAIYEEMVTRLEPMHCPTTSTDWRPEFFKDGLLLIAAGPLRLVDYNASIEALKVLPDLLSAVERVTRLQSNAAQPATPQPQRRGQSQRQHPSRTTSPIRPAQGRDIADAVQRLSAFVGSTYADYIRVRCYPIEGDRSPVLIGDAARAGFRYPLHSLASAYGSEVDAGWSTLALVHRGSDTPPPGTDLSTAAASPTSGSGQTFEDMLELMLSATTQFSGVVSRAASFPSVAVTPLAIFRETVGNDSEYREKGDRIATLRHLDLKQHPVPSKLDVAGSSPVSRCAFVARRAARFGQNLAAARKRRRSKDILSLAHDAAARGGAPDFALMPPAAWRDGLHPPRCGTGLARRPRGATASSAS